MKNIKIAIEESTGEFHIAGSSLTSLCDEYAYKAVTSIPQNIDLITCKDCLRIHRST